MKIKKLNGKTVFCENCKITRVITLDNLAKAKIVNDGKITTLLVNEEFVFSTNQTIENFSAMIAALPHFITWPKITNMMQGK